jgi:hypothetical protein
LKCCRDGIVMSDKINVKININKGFYWEQKIKCECGTSNKTGFEDEYTLQLEILERGR